MGCPGLCSDQWGSVVNRLCRTAGVGVFREVTCLRDAGFVYGTFEWFRGGSQAVTKPRRELGAHV